MKSDWKMKYTCSAMMPLYPDELDPMRDIILEFILKGLTWKVRLKVFKDYDESLN